MSATTTKNGDDVDARELAIKTALGNKHTRWKYIAYTVTDADGQRTTMTKIRDNIDV